MLYRKPNSPFWYADLREAGGGRVSTKRTTKREALAVAEAMRRKLLDRSQLGATEERTLADALARYVSGLEGKHQQSMRVMADKLLGRSAPRGRAKVFTARPGMMLEEVTTAWVTALKDARQAEGYSPNTISQELKMIQRTVRLARDWGWATAPVVKFSLPKRRSKTRRLMGDDEARLLAELDPSRHAGVGEHTLTLAQDAYDLTILLLDTGARVMEASALRWGDVDVQAGTIRLWRTKTDTETVLVMTPRVREMFERRTRRFGNYRHVFPRWEGRAYSRTKHRAYSTGAISRAIARAGLNDDVDLVRRQGKLTVHSFRDTFCSRLIERGLPVRATQDLMGHATASMTAKYTHLEGRAAAERAAELLAG